MAITRVPIQQDRLLLNPKFEGYKLSFLEESRQHFVPIGAPGPGVVVPKLPSSAKLSYRQVQARIRHNHLYPGWNSFKPTNGDSGSTRNGILFAIDDDFMLTVLQYDKEAHRLRSKRLLQIPAPAVPLNFYLEFPVVKPVSPDYILVSDGASTFYLVRLASKGMEYEATIEATTTFHPADTLEADESTPCLLLEAKAFSVTDGNGEQALEVKASTDTAMDVDADNNLGTSLQQPLELSTRVIHSIRGTDIPFYCALDPSNEGYVIGSNTTYKVTKEPVAELPTHFLEPGSEAMDLDGTDAGAAPTSEPPYIWTQTETDVTICFGLPKGTTKQAIHCKFSRQGLALQVNLSQPADQAVRMPNLENMPLFDEIQTDECLWTLESATGILTLNLEKKHAKTRWAQVFAEGMDVDPVEETLDPSAFAEFKSALEKYTTDQANAGPGRASTVHPSLAQDPQEDIDAEGEEIKFSWIQAEDGYDIVRATTIGSGHDWIGQSFPSFEANVGDGQPFRMPSVCMKHDVDGLVYSIQHVPGSAPSRSSIQQASGIMRFEHVSTFDALAFVQASKREKRFVMHDPQGRFAVIVESSRNVYIYWHTTDQKLKQEKQTVVDVSKGQQVDIIGCQLINDGVLVILMEGKHGALVIELQS
ncbi:hypothetical protein BGZ99_007787 [Dissophora globulifera]|uniref:NudC domain-containing protein 1 n=1 Tax=Dissophora globulifera TaxID=979702 RepID=A0A9P6R8H2_9FUNG|nr:hypothetical protein BGZ99_007787 [Dissophora globulifera]